jgi:hypothetical protein
MEVWGPGAKRPASRLLIGFRPGGRVGERATKYGPLSRRRTGDADFPRPALLKALASGIRFSRQTDQPQPCQVLQPSLSLRRTVWPLAASLQMSDQTVPNVAFDLAENTGGIPEGKVVRPSFQVPIQLPNQDRNWLMALMTVRHFVKFLPFPLDCLTRRKYIQVFPIASFQIAVVPKCVAQKIRTCPSSRRSTTRVFSRLISSWNFPSNRDSMNSMVSDPNCFASATR